MNKNDVRWIQRFSNYKKALEKLSKAVNVIKSGHVNPVIDDIIKEGVIQRFEYTHELAWNVMKDFLEDRGTVKLYGSRDSTREAFSADLITDGDLWMDMIISRNKTSHTYNEEIADEIFEKIINDYINVFADFKNIMEKFLKNNEQEQN